MLRRPRYVVTLSGSAGRDSIKVYEQRINALQARLDTTRAVLVRRGVLGRLTVRLRTSQMEEELARLRTTIRAWKAAHDQYGVGQAYRECQFLYGSAQASCQALSYDTLPQQTDTTPPPGK
jgi:hypothetical protein